MSSQPNNRPLEPLRGLPGVYLLIEEGAFGVGLDGANLRREAYLALEDLLVHGGVEVLPSLEELELTIGRPVLTVSADYTQVDQTVFCGIALQLTEDVHPVRDPETAFIAVTWSQIGKFHTPALELVPSLLQAMQVLLGMFVEDFQSANPAPME